jgi:large subunit ribosomal protein L19
MSSFAKVFEAQDIKKTSLPQFNVGDTVDVGVRIKEGDKERVQTFSGIVVARRGGGLRETFSVRRIVDGEGVERVFPLHSPNVVSIEVSRAGKVRRAKLFYLRKRLGKQQRVEEKLNADHLGKMDESRVKKLNAEEAVQAAKDEADAKAKSAAASRAKREVKAKVKAEAEAKAKAKGVAMAADGKK